MQKKFITVVLLAILFAGTFAMLHNVNAQSAGTMKTYSIVDAIPNQIGLGESSLLKTGITEPLNEANDSWTGLTIIVTKPDGTNQTLGPFTSDSTGSTYTRYTPTQLGTYRITSIFPQQPMPSTSTVMERFDMSNGDIIIPKGTIMLASSATTTLTVVQEPSPQYPDQPLPNEYWVRPIDDQLRSWYSISGNWVTRPDNSLALYNDNAPETAHVLWAEDLTTGGMSGGLNTGSFGTVQTGMASGDAYEGKFSNSVILNGILYYNTGPAAGVYGALGACSIKAVDLHTGQTLWVKNNSVLAFGQELYWSSYNVDGVYSYIYTQSGSTWTAYDPFTGDYAFTMTNVPSGQATTRGPAGEILIYVIDYQHNRMMLWNSTLAGLSAGGAVPGTPSYGSWASNVMLKTMDVSGAGCYSWNVSIPAGLAASNSFFSPILKVYDDRVVSMFFNYTTVRVWALNTAGLTSASKSTTKLFDESWTPPAEWLAGKNTLHYVGATNYVHDATYGDGVIGLWDKELTTHYGFSVTTGKYLWSTSSEFYSDAYGWGNAEHTWYYAYGKLYSIGIGGTLYAYDLATGKTAWTYNMSDPFGEPVTGNNWWGWIDLIADGKIYLGTVEHSANNPLPRGAPYICVNATDGSEIFRINGLMRETRWGGNPVIGDSIIAGMDTYDQRIYAIGKGPTQLTVNSPTVSANSGNSFIIQGSVTDISPGTQTSALQMRFPNGVPAVSDASQSAWMLYVYKQFACPTNATGVPLTVSVVDSNGNYRTIGTTTSDSSGHYGFVWKPDITGQFQVYVTFAGSAAYYGSSVTATFYSDAAAPTQAPAATQAPTAADLYFLPAIIGVIIAIIVVGAVLALLVTKKP